MADMINLTCIGCPMGCQISVIKDPKTGRTESITGNTCEVGYKYAENEVTNPSRVVTGTVQVINRTKTVLSVKTREAVSKAKLFDVAGCLKTISVKAPVRIGDVICENICDTKVDLVATSNVE